MFDKHQGYVTSTDLSRDGEKIVSADSKGFIRVWDPLSLKENLLIHAYGNKVTSVVFSPDGTRILSGGRYSAIKVLKIWDSYSGILLDSLNIEGGVNEPVAYSPVGTKIATGSGAIINDRWVNQIKIWDLKDLKKIGGDVLTINSVDKSDSLSFSPDGTKILSYNMSEREIKVWSTITGKRIGSITKILTSFNSCPDVNNFSPDGKKLLINDGKLKIYDVENCDLVLTINGTIKAKAASFSNDGKCILSVNTDDVVFNKNPLYLKLWDSLNGNLISSVNVENIAGPYTSLAFLKILNNISRIICWGRKNNDVGVFEIPFDFLAKKESSKPLKTPTPKMEGPEIIITGPRTFLYGDPINIKTKINDPEKVVGKIEYRVKLMDIQNNKQVFSLIHDWALFLIDKNTEFTNVPLKNYPAGSYILEIRTTSDKGHLLTLSDYDFKISLPLNFGGKLQNNFGTFDYSIIIEDKPKRDWGIDPLFPFYSGSMTIVWSSKNEKRTETHPVHFVVSKDKYKIIGMGRFFRFHLTITDLEGPIVYEHGSVVLSNKLIKLYSSKN
jgi:WD40 repeat protein